MRGKLAVGAIIGAVAGVVAGMLTAPKSGKEARADIKAKADELKTRAETTSRRVKQNAEEVTSRAAGKMQGVVDDAKRGLNK